MNTLKRLWLFLTPWIKRTWKDRGEKRGRTAPSAPDSDSHASKAEPEASLTMVVTRADGSVEHHHAPAQITEE